MTLIRVRLRTVREGAQVRQLHRGGGGDNVAQQIQGKDNNRRENEGGGPR